MAEKSLDTYLLHRSSTPSAVPEEMLRGYFGMIGSSQALTSSRTAVCAALPCEPLGLDRRSRVGEPVRINRSYAPLHLLFYHPEGEKEKLKKIKNAQSARPTSALCLGLVR